MEAERQQDRSGEATASTGSKTAPAGVGSLVPEEGSLWLERMEPEGREGQ